MKTSKKLLALVLVLVMSLSLMGAALAAEDGEYEGAVVILHTNDVHSRVDEGVGYAGVAGMKTYYEEKGAEVLIFDAGDALHGKPIANLSEGKNIAQIMNAVGYTAMAPGNHDFNYGAKHLSELEKDMEFDLLCANFTDKNSGKTLFAPSTVYETEAGITIGVIGIATPETATKSSPLNTEGYSFNGDKLVGLVQAEIDALKDKADVIVALGHLGIDDESEGWRSIDVIEATSGLDLFIDGHSHTAFSELEKEKMAIVEDKDGNEVVLTQTGSYLASLGAVAITDKGIEAATVVDSSDEEFKIPQDKDIAAMIEKLNKELAPQLNEILANTEVELNGERDPGNRTEETNLGDLATDALLYVSGADVALTNGGGIRESLPVDHTDKENEKTYIKDAKEGDITYGDLNSVFPFGNLVVTIEVTGQDIVDALTHGVASFPSASGGFPQVAGMSFVINTSSAGNYVTDVKVGDEDIDLTKTYTLATNDFTAIGGDGYTSLNKPATGYYGGLDEALVSYIVEELEGAVGEDYAKPQGRITSRQGVISFTDVTKDDWFHDDVMFVAGEGIVNGMTATTFEPFKDMTRAMMVTIIYRQYGEPAPEKAASEYFTDITDDELWYANAAAWAFENNIVQGMNVVEEGEKNAFGADVKLNRETMATLFYRYAQFLDIVPAGEEWIKDVSEFADYEEISDWAVEGMEYCYSIGLIQGLGENTLSPAGGANRAQAATIIARFMALDPDTAENGEDEGNGSEETDPDETPEGEGEGTENSEGKGEGGEEGGKKGSNAA